MAKFITVKKTNQQLEQGILPSSLDHGFIPSAEKLEACLSASRSPPLSNQEQAQKLLDELKSSSTEEPIDKKNRSKSLYVVDDYDDEFDEDDGYIENYPYSFQDRKEDRLKTKSSFSKLKKIKDSIKNKLKR